MNIENFHDSSPIRCAIYARTAAADGTDIQLQIAYCRNAAAARGWRVLDNLIFSDSGKDGTTIDDRPGLSALLQALGATEVCDVLLVADFRRLSLNTKDFNRLIEELCWFGLSVCSVTDYADAGDPEVPADLFP